MNVIALDPVLDQITVPLLPRLEIVALQTIHRNCYTEVLYRVRSLVKLTESDFDYLLALGFFMNGQGFTVRSPHDGTEKLSGRWTVNGSSWVSFYEYEVNCVCDSSD
jgi:hypothetical protein